MSNTKLLYELPKLRYQIRLLQSQIDDLRLQAECVGSVRPKEHVQTSPDLSARFEDIIAERAELEEKYQALCEVYYEKAETVQTMITRLHDPELDAEKMARCLRGENPVAGSMDEMTDHIHEEIADVQNVLSILEGTYLYDPHRVARIMEKKMRRWRRRLSRWRRYDS